MDYSRKISLYWMKTVRVHGSDGVSATWQVQLILFILRKRMLKNYGQKDLWVAKAK